MAGEVYGGRARGRRCRVSWLLAGLALLAAPALAQTSPEPKWGPHIDLEAKPGTDRTLGEADLFIPLAQDADTLLFASLRTRMDDSDGVEGNFGLGLRHMLDSGWNLGGYAYFDRRRTPYDNHFNQVTLGLEALSQDWDLRANAYLPQGRRAHRIGDGEASTAELIGTSVQMTTTPFFTEERSMGGFDAEIGWRVPLFDAGDDRQFRIFGGAYHFSESGLEDVTGPRLRAELAFDEVPGLWEGSRFTLGAEWQDDEPRGSQGFLTARLRIPLQVYGRAASTLTPLERRMADPVVRDIDVVSQSRIVTQPAFTETATQLADGRSFSVISSDTTAGTDLDTAVTSAGIGSTVILTGTFNVANNTVSLAFGQSLMGGAIDVRSASGRTATLNSPATIIGTNPAGSTVQLNAGGSISGLTISTAFSGGLNGYSVLIAGGAGNVSVLNNTITATHNAGVAVALGASGAGNAVISGNTITARGSGTASDMIALAITSTFTATVTGNTLSASGGNTSNVLANVNTANINSGSTGNVRGSGDCIGTPASGFIGFTNGPTCP